MKKRRLKRWVKVTLLFILLFTIFISGIGKKSVDEFGNTCYGGIVKICGGN